MMNILKDANVSLSNIPTFS